MRVNKATSVVNTIGVDIIVRESVAPAVNLPLVDNAAVVVGRVDGVVLIRADVGLTLATLEKEGGTVEGRAQTGNDGEMDLVVTLDDGEGSAVAAPDVDGGGLDVAAVVALTLKEIAVDAASDVANGSLGVDDEVLIAEAVPNLVAVLGPVVGKGSTV